MPKISQPIPDWIRNLKYPTHNEPDEFTYQIFLRKSAFGTWEAALAQLTSYCCLNEKGCTLACATFFLTLKNLFWRS